MLKMGGLFSGIGGFEKAFQDAGFAVVWCVEIEEDCHHILRRHFPNAKLHGDVRGVGAHNLEPVDAITFGSPCQSLSVAGKREGMKGVSGIFFEAIRVIRELRPRFCLWENVAGALSSYSGNVSPPGGLSDSEWEAEEDSDFFAAINAIRECGGRDTAWRICDSQWWGVAQRRRRCFAVGDLRASRGPEILSLPESLQGHPKPSREAGAAVTGESARGIDFRNSKFQSEGLSGTIQAKKTGGYSLNYTTGILQPVRIEVRCAEITTTLDAHFGSKWGQDNQHINGGAPFFVIEETIPILEAGARTGKSTTDPRAGMGVGNAGDPMFTLSEKNHAVAFYPQAGTMDLGDCNEHAPPLGSATGRQVAVAFHARQDPIVENDCMIPLERKGGQAVAHRMIVRRLTPTECARLQFFPDDWARWGIDTKGRRIEMSDSFQYRSYGNAVTVSVILWIAQNMMNVFLDLFEE